MNSKTFVALALSTALATSAFGMLKPKITMAQARATALKRAPGKVKSQELENEHGKLIYSFDIASAKKSGVTEVNVDAMNGKIVAVQHETAAKEASEKANEKH